MLRRPLKDSPPLGGAAADGVLAGLSAHVNTSQFVAENVRLHGIEIGSREMFEEMNRFIEIRVVRAAPAMRPGSSGDAVSRAP